MALKIDISKAFDSLEWSFIKDTLCNLDLPHSLVNLIMSCVTKASFYVLWSREITYSFLPSTGIREGDSLFLSIHFCPLR